MKDENKDREREKEEEINIERIKKMEEMKDKNIVGGRNTERKREEM